MSDIPNIGGRQPVPVDVVAGQSYWWCTCGSSKSQPFCDGSHQGTTFAPVEWVAEQTRRVFFCACKRSAKGALCDGSHSKL
ncbi:MAG TPA: CDGSH iron-sulfur domain-containing protein [Xanthobacteraceae bacterium]|jgi:CDGSH-type Zn-finger protein|nr:CDGSH iron-sulfur domain-containing protein [Xanthobacteraceae bacterium]